MKFMSTIGLLAILASVSCSGGSTPEEIVIPDPDPTQIVGTIEITGAPLASLDDTGLIGSQDDKNWSVKLIDPVEDVDSLVIPVGNTTFGPVEVTIAGEYLLSVSLLPALDLTGGQAATTPVVINIPVVLETAETTQVYVSIEVLSTLAASGVRAASQAEGHRLRLRYTVETRAIRNSDFIEIDWTGHQLRHDTNGDNLLDDEHYFADSDRDGISDELREQMRDRMHQPTRFTVEGLLTDIEHHRRIFIGDAWFKVTDRTEVWQHTQRIHLGDLEVGQLLRVKGRFGNGDIRYAEEIRVLNQADRPPMSGS